MIANVLGRPSRGLSRNGRMAMIGFGLAAAMLGLGFASVPLYRLFCAATGYNGTTQRVDDQTAEQVKAASNTISIRFDTNVERGMPWKFRALQTTDEITIGVRDMALFWAKNMSDAPLTGTASFNVQPEQAGKYFNKIQCFCFTEQTLKAGEEVRMPVLYYVDPAILNDPDTKDIQQITLSYTFHPAVNAGAKALDRVGSGK
jgi:cytochrome c oxidase assembly protein subunit 11